MVNEENISIKENKKEDKSHPDDKLLDKTKTVPANKTELVAGRHVSKDDKPHPDEKLLDKTKTVPTNKTELVAGRHVSKDDKTKEYYQPENRPGVFVEEVETDEELILHPDHITLQREFTSPIFLSILVFCLFGAIVFMINAYLNPEIINLEIKYGRGLSIVWFLVINLIFVLLIAHMVYKPYMLDRSNKSLMVLYALLFYQFTFMLWSTALFHTRFNRDVAMLSVVLLLVTTIWLGYVCYNFEKQSILIFILLLIWTFYLMIYTFDVELHAWKRIE